MTVHPEITKKLGTNL